MALPIQNDDFAAGFAALLGLDAAKTAALADLLEGWAQGGAGVAVAAGRSAKTNGALNGFLRQAIDWYAGEPTGGPNGDGLYPLTDSVGNTVMTPSPSRLQADLTGFDPKGSVATVANLPAVGEQGDLWVVTATGDAWGWSDRQQQWRNMGPFRSAKAAVIAAGQLPAGATDAQFATWLANSQVDAVQETVQPLIDGANAAVVATAGLRVDLDRRSPNVSPYQALPYAAIGPQDDIRLAVDDKGRLLADIGTAYEAMGPTLFRDPSILHGVGFNGDLAHGRRANGAPFDFGVARVPVPAIEVIGGRSRLVAYSPSGERMVLSGADFDYVGGHPAYGLAARCAVNRPMYGPSRVVAVALDGSGVEIPDDPNMIVLLLGLGQSLMAASNGTDAYFHTTGLYPNRTRMFRSTIYSDVRCGLNAQIAVNPVLDPATITGLTPAVAKAGATGYGGQDALTAAANAMQLAAVRHCGKPLDLIVANAALGGGSQAQLGPGTNAWNNSLVMVQKAVEFAAAEGKYVYVVVLRSQGETDATASSDTYAAAEISHKDQFSTAVKAITGQQGDVPWVVSQWSSLGESADNESGNNTSVIGIQKAEALDPTHYMIVAPDYGDQAYYATDRVHFLGRGYTRKGERFGRMLLDRIFGNTGKPALRWTSVAYDAGAQKVIATANREAGDLVIDTTEMPAHANFGLEVSVSSGNFKTISSVAVVGNTVEITMAAPLVGAHMLNTGMLGHDATRLPATQPRTNIRDASLAHFNVDGQPIRSWMIHQRNQITGL